MKRFFISCMIFTGYGCATIVPMGKDTYMIESGRRASKAIAKASEFCEDMDKSIVVQRYQDGQFGLAMPDAKVIFYCVDKNSKAAEFHPSYKSEPTTRIEVEKPH